MAGGKLAIFVVWPTSAWRLYFCDRLFFRCNRHTPIVVFDGESNETIRVAVPSLSSELRAKMSNFPFSKKSVFRSLWAAQCPFKCDLCRF